MRRRAIAPHSSYALLSLGGSTLDTTEFDERGHRVGGALGTAIATHAIVLLAILAFARLQPSESSLPPALTSAIGPFIFTAGVGEGSGRSGGGNRSSAPAALARTRGADVRAVAAASPPVLATPDTISPEREPAPALPVRPMDAGALPQIGAVDGVPGPPTAARGPGDDGVGTRPGRDRGLGEGPGDGVGDRPYGIGNGVTGPALLHRTQPQYSADAMRAKIQGVAVLSGIVGVDGTLHDIRVARSLDGTFGLDQEAIACVRQWRFRPARARASRSPSTSRSRSRSPCGDRRDARSAWRTSAHLRRLRWESADELLAALQPEAQLLIGPESRRLDVDIALHRPAGEVHLPNVFMGERIGVVVLADARHQLVPGNADEHQAAVEEGEPAEHPLLGQRGLVRQG